jgi:putative phage-type endonuclease
MDLSTIPVTPTGVLVTAAEPETDEWFAARRGGITGTDLPKILGLTKYGNALSVWLDKRGELDDDAGEAARWGQLLEETVAQEWAARNGTAVHDVGVLAHTEQHWMRASLDRLVASCPDGEQARCALEVKTRSAWVADQWAEGVPDSVLAQTTWGLMVTGLDHHHVAALIGGQRLVSYRVDRDQVLEDYLLTAARPVWQAVVAGDPPDAHPDSEGVLLELLDRLYAKREGDRELDPEAGEWLAVYQDGLDQEKRGQALKTQAKTALVQMLDDGDTGLLNDAPAFTYKRPEPGYDLPAAELRRLRKERPYLFAALVNRGFINPTNPGPRFTVKKRPPIGDDS